MKKPFRYLKRRLTQGANLLPFSSKVIGTPRGCMSVYEYVKGHPQTPIIYLNKEKKIEIPAPHLNNDHFAGLFVSSRYTKDQYVFQLQNARVWGEYGAVISKEDIFLADVSREFKLKNPCKDHSVFHNIRLNTPVNKKEIIAVIATAGSDTYYHWILDILPRILFLKECGLFSEVSKFIINYNFYPYQKQTLELLGIDDSQIINCFNNRSFHIETATLYVPSLPSNLNEVNEYECRLLKKYLFQVGQPQNTPKRIYLSRRVVATRTVINEDELVAYLKKFDFEIIEPERLTFQQQMQYFNNAEMIIGPHGSAFTNMIFSKTGTILIELIPDSYLIACFYNIAAILGIEYYGYIEKGIPVDANNKIDNIRINMKSFKSFFEKIVT